MGDFTCPTLIQCTYRWMHVGSERSSASSVGGSKTKCTRGESILMTCECKCWRTGEV